MTKEEFKKLWEADEHGSEITFDDKVKTYSRTEYLKWCEENGVKTILPESKRNKFTISGYPTFISGFEIIDDDIDADEWYKTHGW